MTLHFRRDSLNTPAEQFSDLCIGKNLENPVRTYSNVNIIDNYTDVEPQTCLQTASVLATETEIGVLLKSSPVKSCELGYLETVRMTLYLFSRPLLTCL